MKRPFAVIGFSSLFAAVVLSKFSIFAVNVTFFVALAVFLLSLIDTFIHKRLTVFTFISIGVAVTSLALSFSMNHFVNALKYQGEKVSVSATVTENSYSNQTEKLKLKIQSINNEKDSFYITVYNTAESGFKAGDKITATLDLQKITDEDDSVEYFLAQKCYFTAFSMSNAKLIGENKYYKAINKIKECYKNAVYSYLPNELGTVATAMTIGDRSGMSKYLRNIFNYSGTAHLLVVSGLHLTLWVGLISEAIPFLRRKRILNFIFSLAFVILYLSLTGFSVSVIRAGVMILMMKLSLCFKKDADSINSIGIALMILIISNPFSANSVALWLSVASTLGLLLFSKKIENQIYKKKICRMISKNKFGKLVIESLVVSLSVTVLTLPVFILKFKMFPILSFVSNALIVTLGTLLMVVTVLGALLHIVGVFPLAKVLFYLVGLIAKFLVFMAEKIGMLKFSTIGISTRYFRVYLACAVILISLFFLLKKYKNVQTRLLVLTLSLGFGLTTLLSYNADYFHPSVDVVMGTQTVTVFVRDGDRNVLTGVKDNGTVYSVGEILGSYNLKTIDCIFITENDSFAPADVMRITNVYKANYMVFKGQMLPALPVTCYAENIDTLKVNNDTWLKPISSKTSKVKQCGKDIYISCDKTPENLFKNTDKYDIIILSMDAYMNFGEDVKKYLKNSSSQILVLQNGERITIYPDKKKIYYSEKI